MKTKFNRLLPTLLFLYITIFLSFYAIALKTASPEKDFAQIQPTVYISDSFPLKDPYLAFFKNTLNYKVVSSPSNADIVIDKSITGPAKEAEVIYTKLYLLVSDFKSATTNITSEELNTVLSAQTTIAPKEALFDFPMVPVSNDTFEYVNSHPGDIALIPFEQLTNQYKLLTINNENPLEKNFNINNYQLKSEFSIFGRTNFLSQRIKDFTKTNTYTNYDSSQIHSIILTGTTALGRGEYFRIQSKGYQYPALYVKDILHDADITHVSNETSFVPGCTQEVGTLKFCALPSFMNTLIYAGINLVELTGNHNNDWGSVYANQSLTLYGANNIKHFGGGLNADDARKPAVIKLGNTTFAFLGYNQPGPTYAFASATTAGAAKLDEAQMVDDIKHAKQIADVVLVDVQWENENNLEASSSQVSISKEAIDAGASVVTGSQAHRPQGMSFYNNGTIMYGLGNLFFDQMEHLETRQGVISKQVFYNNKLIQTDLIPTLLYDYSQPRPATGKDAQAILDEVWQASINLY